jgi:hypothetical protein
MEETRQSRKPKDKKKDTKKKSGVRTKFLIESLGQDCHSLRDKNDRLRELAQANAKVSNVDDLNSKMGGSKSDEGDEDGDDDDEDC